MRFASHLQTPRLQLRPLRMRHFAFFCRLLGNRQVRACLGGPVPWKARLRQFRAYRKGHADIGIWCLTQADSRPIGLIVVTPDRSGSAWELSYQILPRFWGNGLAKDAAACVLDHLRNQDKRPIVAETQVANTSSRKLLSRLGFIESKRLTRFGAEQILYTYAPTQNQAEGCTGSTSMRSQAKQHLQKVSALLP